jgi:hypothetical protein
MIKLKVFTGYASQVELAFNTWFQTANVQINTIKADEQRLYIFYVEKE